MLAKSQRSDTVVEVPIWWSFHDYVDGGNPIEDWYVNDLLDGGRFGFDNLLKDSSKIKSELQWSGFKYPPDLRKEKIWQLAFTADSKQYRVLGVFRPGRQAVLLIGCYHKGKVYTPPNALDTVLKRAKFLREGKVSTRERKIKFNL
jgi:Gp49-like protein DUF891